MPKNKVKKLEMKTSGIKRTAPKPPSGPENSNKTAVKQKGSYPEKV